MSLTAGELQRMMERRGMRQDCPRCAHGQIDFFVNAPPGYAGGLDVLEVALEDDGTVRMECLNCGFRAFHDLTRLMKSENP